MKKQEGSKIKEWQDFLVFLEFGKREIRKSF